MKYLIEIEWNKTETFEAGRVVREYEFMPFIGMDLWIENTSEYDDIQYTDKWISEMNEGNPEHKIVDKKAESISGKIVSVRFDEYFKKLWDSGEGAESAPFIIKIEPED